MPTYNKLVRDNIPDIIASSGRSYTVKTLSNDDFVRELHKKAKEELIEYLKAAEDGIASNSDAIEELADLLEVIYTLGDLHGASKEELEQVRKQKAEERGGFKQRLYLMDVED